MLRVKGIIKNSLLPIEHILRLFVNVPAKTQTDPVSGFHCDGRAFVSRDGSKCSIQPWKRGYRSNPTNRSSDGYARRVLFHVHDTWLARHGDPWGFLALPDVGYFSVSYAQQRPVVGSGRRRSDLGHDETRADEYCDFHRSFRIRWFIYQRFGHVYDDADLPYRRQPDLDAASGSRFWDVAFGVGIGLRHWNGISRA